MDLLNIVNFNRIFSLQPLLPYRMRYFNQEKSQLLSLFMTLRKAARFSPPSLSCHLHMLLTFVEKRKAKCEYANSERDIFLLLSFLLLEKHDFESEN